MTAQTVMTINYLYMFLWGTIFGLLLGIVLVLTVKKLIGMSLRDWFAGMALQGHLANESTMNHPSYDRDSFVNECYVMADAMIERRKM